MRLTKGVNLNSNVIWLASVLFIAVITGIAIADKKWIYFAVILSPLIIYLCIHKPFIFPFGAYVFLLPFDNLLSVTGFEGGATLTKLLGVLTILVLTIKGAFENKLKKPDAVLIWWVLFIMYGLLTVYWAINPERVLSKLPTAIGLILLYLVVASYKIQKSEFETIKWCILFGGFIAVLCIIYNYHTGSFYYVEQRSGLKFGGRSVSPNVLGFILLLPISVCIEMLLRQKNKLIIKSLFVIIAGVFAYGVLLTGSRGAALSVGIVIIVYILFLRQRLNLAIILTVVGVLIYSLIPGYLFERFGSSIESGGSGRLDIWYAGWLAIKKYWVLGAGLNNFPEAYNQFAQYSSNFIGWDLDSHNLYIGVLTDLGIVGITLMVVAMRKHYKAIQARFTHYNINTVMLKASFWAVLFCCIFGTHLWSKAFWLLWMMIMMHKNILEDKLNSNIVTIIDHRAD